MTVTRDEIAATLSRYLARHPDERPGVEPLLRALDDANADMASRATAPGHVTCGAALMDGWGRVLLIHHRALNRWLMPGGHLEPTDTSLHTAATRELAEETGVPGRHTVSPPGMDMIPVDIDLHRIPANSAKEESEHWHADFRYAFWTGNPEVELQLDEVTDHGWRPPDNLHPARLAAKINRITSERPQPGR